MASRARACAGILSLLACLCAGAVTPAAAGDAVQQTRALRQLAAPMTAVERRNRFVKVLLPLLQAANHRIVKERRMLLALVERRRQGQEISTAEHDWFAAIAERYSAPADDLDELLRRVDVVPPSLALGQAALESGWGTSRGAQGAAALFGEMARNGRRVRRFESPAHSVAAYVANLNTHHAYRGFRQARAAARQDGQPLDSRLLAVHLQRYSELGGAYVRHVQGMIRANGLQAFDDLLDGAPLVTVAEVPKNAPDEPPL